MTLVLDSFQVPAFPVQRFTVEEYHELIQTGCLDENDQVELIQGWIVPKMPRDPEHDGTIGLAEDAFRPLLPNGWRIRVQCAITTLDSEPEPDLSIVFGLSKLWLKRHPGPRDIGMLIEVSESSLAFDRNAKGTAYAAAGIAVYWIINLVDRQVEVYTQPSATGYKRCRTQGIGRSIAVQLQGKEVGRIAVRELLP